MSAYAAVPWRGDVGERRRKAAVAPMRGGLRPALSTPLSLCTPPAGPPPRERSLPLARLFALLPTKMHPAKNRCERCVQKRLWEWHTH